MGNEHGTGFGPQSTAAQVARKISMAGKNVIVTGANTGLGKETCRVLAKMGAHVIMGCRDMTKAAEAKQEIEQALNNEAQLTLLKLDLADLDSVESFVHQFEELNIPLHVLINNAGVMAIPYRETVNGFEMQFGTNHVGHFHLTNLLLPKLKEGEPSRVVVLTSSAHKFDQVHFDDLKGKDTWYKGVFGRWNGYGQSKTANLLFALEFNRRMHLAGNRITANALHPGVIKTELIRDLGPIEKLAMTIGSKKTVQQGAATSIFVATAPELEGIGGKYFEDCNEAVPKAWASNPRYAKKLWTVTEELIKNAPRPNKDEREAHKAKQEVQDEPHPDDHVEVKLDDHEEVKLDDHKFEHTHSGDEHEEKKSSSSDSD